MKQRTQTAPFFSSRFSRIGSVLVESYSREPETRQTRSGGAGCATSKPPHARRARVGMAVGRGPAPSFVDAHHTPRPRGRLVISKRQARDPPQIARHDSPIGPRPAVG